MVVRYDGKGKYFTDVISKEKVSVTIQTVTHCIHGNVHVRPDERLKDELDRANGFLAVTDAEVFSIAGDLIYRSHFMTINTAHVIWLLPDDERIDVPGNERVNGND